MSSKHFGFFGSVFLLYFLSTISTALVMIHFKSCEALLIKESLILLYNLHNITHNHYEKPLYLLVFHNFTTSPVRCMNSICTIVLNISLCIV